MLPTLFSPTPQSFVSRFATGWSLVAIQPCCQAHLHTRRVRAANPGQSMAMTSPRQHPLLLWLDATGYEGSLSLGAYYLLLFACAWFVLRRGRAWARSRSLLVGNINKKSEGGDGDGAAVRHKPPQLTYVDSPRNRRLLARTSLLARPYKPSPWLGHRVSGARDGGGKGKGKAYRVAFSDGCEVIPYHRSFITFITLRLPRLSAPASVCRCSIQRAHA